MSRRLTKEDIDRIKQQQKSSTQLEIMDVIVKPGNQTYKLQVPANGSFEVEQLLITYTTLDDDGGNPVDNGVSGISLKIKDRGTQRELTDLLPIESIATPGRVKSLAASGADSNVLQISLLAEGKYIAPPSFSIIRYLANPYIAKALLENHFPTPFIISSERTGVSLFYRELDINKNMLVERLQNPDKQFEISNYLGMIEEVTSRYALPIKKGIDFVRDIFDIHSKKKSQLIKEHPEFLKMIQEVAGGEYEVENNQILFAFGEEKIPLYMASSAVKSILELYFYIISIAKKGDILMIDEPELNLHPANQRKLARLFARLVNVGIKVFVTTHSDYLIKELNNLIMLSDEFEYKDEVLKKLKYSHEDNLHPSHIKAYIANKKTLSLAPITEYGIGIDSFDKEIGAINHVFNEITLAKGI